MKEAKFTIRVSTIIWCIILGIVLWGLGYLVVMALLQGLVMK